MRHRGISRALLCSSLIVAPLSGCLQTSTPVDPEGADYPAFDPATPSEAGTFDSGVVGVDGGPVFGPLPPGSPGSGDAGPSTPIVDAGRGVDAGQRDAGVSQGDAGDSAVSDPPDAAPSGPSALHCTFTSTTNASGKAEYNGKYGCAVWVGDESRRVIKAFIVASRVASRTNLPSYKTAVSGITVDVVTSATLTQARDHSYTWDTEDASGNALADGTYTLNVETHSSTGVDFVSVPFVKGPAPVDVVGGADGDIKSTKVHCE